MSMWLNLARVDASAFAYLEAHPSLIGALFFAASDADAAKLAELGVAHEHRAGADYRSAHEGLLAMAEHTGEPIDEDDPVLEDLGVGGALDFEATYGPAFFVKPADVAERAAFAMVNHLDDEVQRVIAEAVQAGHYLVGVVS